MANLMQNISAQLRENLIFNLVFSIPEEPHIS